MTGFSSSILDVITRTYLNAAGNTIATQTLSITSYPVNSVNTSGMNLTTADGLSTNRFLRRATIRLKTTTTTSTATSKVIASVVTSGRFNVRNESGGDVINVVYSGVAPQNDIIVPVTEMAGVFKVGDSI